MLESFCLAIGVVRGKGSEPEGVVEDHMTGKRGAATILDVCQKQTDVTESPVDLTFLGYS